MTNNDVLRQLRYALNINDSTMIAIFKLAGHEIEQANLASLLKKEDEEGFVNCGDAVLGYFLDGLSCPGISLSSSSFNKAKQVPNFRIRVAKFSPRSKCRRVMILAEIGEA